MARPTKEGLDYFPFDVDFHNDEKIEIISGEFGVKGEVIAIRLLCAIYRNGYFIEWSEALKYKLAKRTNLSSNLIGEILTRLIKWGFFDQTMFDSFGILTSRGIQKRYEQITKKRKNDSKEYWISSNSEFPQQKPAETIVNSAETIVNSELTTQRKVKESKGNKSKGNFEVLETSTPKTQPAISVFEASSFLPDEETIVENTSSQEVSFIHNELLKALGKTRVSEEEIIICKRLFSVGCTYEDIKTARINKGKNFLKYLENHVCEVRDARKQSEEESIDYDDLPV